MDGEPDNAYRSVCQRIKRSYVLVIKNDINAFIFLKTRFKILIQFWKICWQFCWLKRFLNSQDNVYHIFCLCSYLTIRLHFMSISVCFCQKVPILSQSIQIDHGYLQRIFIRTPYVRELIISTFLRFEQLRCPVFMLHERLG